MEYLDSYTGPVRGSGATAPPPVATASAPYAGPPAAPPAPAPRVQAVPGSSPNYTDLIQADPGFVAARNATTMNNEQAAARRRAAIRDAYVRYGGNLPSGFQDQYGDLDQTTQDAARGNQQSVLAQLAYRYQQSAEQFRRGLSARGQLQSSELDYGTDQLNRGLAQQQYDAANAFTGEVNQDISGYVGEVGQSAQAMSSAIGQAESNVYSNPAYRPREPVYADYDASSSAQFGQPIYSGPDGNYYDSNGNPFQPPAPHAVTATPDDWRATTGTSSLSSPGVASSDLAYLYGGS